MGLDLDAARVKTLPDEAFYIADFITEDEETTLLQKVWRSFEIDGTKGRRWGGGRKIRKYQK